MLLLLVASRICKLSVFVWWVQGYAGFFAISLQIFSRVLDIAEGKKTREWSLKKQGDWPRMQFFYNLSATFSRSLALCDGRQKKTVENQEFPLLIAVGWCGRTQGTIWQCCWLLFFVMESTRKNHDSVWTTSWKEGKRDKLNVVRWTSRMTKKKKKRRNCKVLFLSLFLPHTWYVIPFFCLGGTKNATQPRIFHEKLVLWQTVNSQMTNIVPE